MKSALLITLAFIAGLWAYHLQAPANWTCSAEDEVLIIDNTCVHIDTPGIN